MLEPEPSLHALDPTLLHTFTPTTLHARTMRSTSGGFRYGKQVHPSHMPRRQKRWMTRYGNRCQSANHSCLCGAKDANRPALGRTVCWRILPKTFWRKTASREGSRPLPHLLTARSVSTCKSLMGRIVPYCCPSLRYLINPMSPLVLFPSTLVSVSPVSCSFWCLAPSGVLLVSFWCLAHLLVS